MMRKGLSAAPALAFLAAWGGGDSTEVPTRESLAAELGCLSCHTDRDTAAGSTLIGIWGTDVQIADGRTVNVDEEYVRRSIIEPGVDVVEGYGPIMPPFTLEDDWVRSME